MDTDTTQSSFSGGELLAGKYRIEKVIGQGGMGVVLAAEHLALNQKVAIKLLRQAALEQTDIVGRFMQEARAAVRLRSEHVARVIDVGSLDDGRPYIVMELLEGQDLGDVIDKSASIPIPTAVDYVLQACEAIAEAHAAGIIHRDLKPKNLFLTHAVHGRPLVKVLDFGISKLDARAGQEMQLTRTTEVIGSPSYMSPEQLRSSRNVDARTDIWALGVILYELLTRRVPFYAQTVTELAIVVVTEREPPVRSLRPEVPEGLEQIVARCLAKSPEDRFPSVVELVQALEPFTSGQYSTATDRVRAVAGHPVAAARAMMSGSAPPPPAVSSGALPPLGANPTIPMASASSRVNVHGGTSVAWGETQSDVGLAPPHLRQPPSSSSSGMLIGGIVAAFLTVAAIGGGVFVYHAKRASAQPPPAAATGDETMPLPSGRKDLPPIGEAPSASSSVTPAPSATPSALPETRKPAPPSKPATKSTGTRPTEPKNDDLSNIGRR